MKILAIDCASVSASVALLENGQVLAEHFAAAGLTHSCTLLPMTESLLSVTRNTAADIDLFAVTAGPGSFTGVRIGVSAVKGLADAQEKPCFAVSALAAAAYPFAAFSGVVCAVMDARCAQVYTACFRNGARITEDAAMKITQLGEMLQAYDEAVLLVGDGMQLVYDTLQATTQLQLALAPPQLSLTRASSVALLAQQGLANGESTVPACALQPFYLRLPQAERELNNKKLHKQEGE